MKRNQTEILLYGKPVNPGSRSGSPHGERYFHDLIFLRKQFTLITVESITVFERISFKVPLHLFFSLRNLIELDALILKQKTFLRSELWLLCYDLSKS